MIQVVKANCPYCKGGPVKHKVTFTGKGVHFAPAKCYRCGHKWEAAQASS
jgi:hypothetical protein